MYNKTMILNTKAFCNSLHNCKMQLLHSINYLCTCPKPTKPLSGLKITICLHMLPALHFVKPKFGCTHHSCTGRASCQQSPSCDLMVCCGSVTCHFDCFLVLVFCKVIDDICPYEIGVLLFLI